MKYLKYLVEDENVQSFLSNKKETIDTIISEDFIQFSKKLNQFVYENLDQFVDENNTFFNIKKFALDQSLIFLQEMIAATLVKGAVVGIGSIIGWEWFKSFLDKLWQPFTHPAKAIVFTVDDKFKSVVESFQKTTAEIPSEITINPEPAHFISMPLLTILAVASTIYTGSKLLDKYDDITKISKLKNNIDSVFDRVTALGAREAENYKQFNTSKYEEAINRCKDKTSPFEVFDIKISCPLDAYLTYCSSMILSLTNIYLTRVSRTTPLAKLDNMRSVLSIKEDFAVNQMLLSCYNNFMFAINFIYKDEPGIVTKWKTFIDSNIEKIISNIKPRQSESSPVNKQTEGTYVKQSQQSYKRY